MTFFSHLVWPISQGALPLSRGQKIGLRIVCVLPLLESHCASVFCDGINFDCVWLCCFYIWKRERETERNNNKRSWCLWIGHWFCCSWLYGPPFLRKTGTDMEACTAARAKAVAVDGVRVDSQWQLKYPHWGLRDGLGAAGLGGDNDTPHWVLLLKDCAELKWHCNGMGLFATFSLHWVL